jgi:hypothetical protein
MVKKIGNHEFNDDGVDIVEPTIEAMDKQGYGWGAGFIILTKKDIDALLSGKLLAYDDGEYMAYFIYE